MKVIAGKNALVTGAASGIGRAIALRLAREGARLHLLDIDAARLQAVVDEARRLGAEATGSRCDVAQSRQITAGINEVLNRWDHVDLLVNNAGVAYYGPTIQMTDPQWEWLLAINLLAPIQFVRELLPRMLTRPDSHILNVASMFGTVGSGGLTGYCTTKFGLVGFSEALRAECRPYGVGVSALCPGFVDTNLFKAAATDFPGRAPPSVPAWLCTTPETVANRAIRAIQRNQQLALVTPLAHALYYTRTLAPWILDIVARFRDGGKASRSTQRRRMRRAA